MQQVYHLSPQGNFGDDLNAWFWDVVLPDWRSWDSSVTLIGIGTILNAGLLPSGKKLVIGSGVGYGGVPDMSNCDEWDIRAVRGPRTAKTLGLDASKALSDPAIILPCLDMFHGIEKTNDVVFVPHVGSDQSFDWAFICDRLSLQYQSPSACPKIVIKRLASARRVIVESMHAAIIADAFGTPWTAVEINKGFNRFKWLDWAESLEMRDLEIRKFFPVMRQVQSTADLMRTSIKKKPSQVRTVKVKNPPAATDRTRNGKALHALAWAHLRQVSREKQFRLSDRTVLEMAQRRYSRLFRDIHKDYA